VPRIKTTMTNTMDNRISNQIIYLMRAKKIMSPSICQILLTGFTNVKRSRMVLFQSHLPTKLIIITAIKKDIMEAIISIKASRRLESEPDISVKASTQAYVMSFITLGILLINYINLKNRDDS